MVRCMKQEELIKSCSKYLYRLCDLIESMNCLNYYDINISSEYFFIPILNQLFDCELRNINAETKNATTIDLYDVKGKLAIQVTSDSSSKKIRDTLRKYCKNKFYEQYNRLVIVVITRSHKYRTDFTNDIGDKFIFSSKEDIYTIDSLIKRICALNIEKLSLIQTYLEYQLGIMLDSSKVMSISKSFEYINQNTGGILSENFFELDDENFIQCFKTKLNTCDTIHVVSLSEEEGIYCILNLINKLKIKEPTYVIKSEDAWHKAENNLLGCILIPWFVAYETPSIKGNKTVFVHGEEQFDNAIILPRRTCDFLLNKLQECGYQDAYRLIQKTHGLNYYIKLNLFTGNLKHPKWEDDVNRAIYVALLLGRWTDNEADRLIIELLYDNDYESFIFYLNQYIDTADAFIHRRNRYSNKVHELVNPSLSIYSHKNVVNLPIIKTFIDLSERIISKQSIFNQSNDKCGLLGQEKASYSHALKQGVARTFVLLALYANYQEEISRIVECLLQKLHSTHDWVYISLFIRQFCEAAPGEVLDYFESNTNNNELLELFNTETSDLLTARHNYLWCLEQLLLSRRYASRAVRVLFDLGEIIDKCTIGNNPRTDVSRAFSILCNVTALSKEEKLELAKIGVRKHSYFWNILFNELEQKNFIFSNSTFIYRDTERITPYEANEISDFRNSYIQILVSNAQNDLSRIIKLIDLLTEYSDDLFDMIYKEISSYLSTAVDSEKELIKTKLRTYVYQQKLFAHVKAVASPIRVKMVEELCRGISFDDPAYDFLYLMNKEELPLYNPLPIKLGDDYWQKNATLIENTVVSEILRMKESKIDIDHYLSLSRDTSGNRIGEYIAKYYSKKFDENIFESIIKSSNHPSIAVDYVVNCPGSKLENIYRAIKFLKRGHFDDVTYVAFILLLPLNTDSKSIIQELPDSAFHYYWCHLFNHQLIDDGLLYFAIDNLLKHENWTVLFNILHDRSERFDVEQILQILSRAIESLSNKMQLIGSNLAYLVENVFSIIYNRVQSNFECYPLLFDLEIRCFDFLGWNNMKCSQYLFLRNACYYAKMLSKIYPRDDGSFDTYMDKERFVHFVALERDIKFCPGHDGESVNLDILNNWINSFRTCLETQGQLSLFYHKLGYLFANSPIGSDGLFPHESIRLKIEEIGNNDLVCGFVLCVLNGRGGYILTGGKEELELADKFEDLSIKLAIRYPVTAKIFRKLCKCYRQESEQDIELYNEIYNYFLIY